MNQANFHTTTLAMNAVVAMPPSNSRALAGAWTTGPWQARQAYFGRIVHSTRTVAGTPSKASNLSSPMRCSWPAQQGQSVLWGSITSVTRGRCLGRKPILRCAVLRGLRCAAARGVSSLAAGLLRPRPAKQSAQRLQRGLQPLDFGIAIEDDGDQNVGVPRPIFCAKRHNGHYPGSVHFPSKYRRSPCFYWPFHHRPRHRGPLHPVQQKRHLRRRQTTVHHKCQKPRSVVAWGS